jgi:hypothetical protein
MRPRDLPLCPAAASVRLLAVTTVVCVLSAAGCATYSEQLAEASRLADRGDYAAAMRAVNALMGVRSAEELPDRWDSHTALALLERAVLLQALGRYRTSARDLRAADQALEVLDLTADPVGSLGRWVYSDASGVYRVTAVEQLAMNPLNMLNYLASDDLQGAAVEARRFTVMRNYLDGAGTRRSGRLGSYLAGFVFEQLGEWDRALRYYDEALAEGPLETLREAVPRLAARGGYRGEHIRQWLDGHDRTMSRHGPPTDGEVLVVVAMGRVPRKVPERLPVGLAVGIAGTHITGDPEWLTRAAGKVIVYPELAERWGVPGEPTVHIGGRPVRCELVADQAAEVRHEHEQMKPMIVGAAQSRLIARAAAAEGVRASIGARGSPTEVFGTLAVELSLMALDKPDTRSWTFLPGRVLVARSRLSPGDHAVSITLPGGQARRYHVAVAEGSYQAIVVTCP